MCGCRWNSTWTGTEEATPPPIKLNTLPGSAPMGNTITNLPVYRTPCGVAQCLALNLADTAQIEYGTYLQLHQIMESMQ